MFTKYAVVLLRGTEKKIIAFNDLNSAREKAGAFHKRYEKCYIRVDIIPFKTPELCDFDHYDMSNHIPEEITESVRRMEWHYKNGYKRIRKEARECASRNARTKKVGELYYRINEDGSLEEIK